MRARLKNPHEKYMRAALREAQKAAREKEVPVGAVIVYEGRVIARAHNRTERKQSALLHAEMAALQKASVKQSNWRLEDCDLYVTLEPCTMCAGAMVLSRVRTVYYGTPDPKAGAVDSTARVLANHKLNHRVVVESGILKEECSAILTSFFKSLRSRKRS
ncbi:MAG: tRNA adenosine(34) deaminase TadA [bacterium]